MVPMKPPKSNLPDEKSPKDLILEQAGATNEHIALMLRQALEVATQKLYAKTTKLVTHQGEIKSEVHFDDNKTQLEAAKFISEFAVKVAGLQAKNESGPRTIPQVVVNIPSADQLPEIKKATPKLSDVAEDEEDYI